MTKQNEVLLTAEELKDQAAHFDELSKGIVFFGALIENLFEEENNLKEIDPEFINELRTVAIKGFLNHMLFVEDSLQEAVCLLNNSTNKENLDGFFGR